MTTLTLKLKKKTVVHPVPANNIGQFAPANHIGQFAIMRKSSTSKHMRFSAFHSTYQSAEAERQRLKSITDNYVFFIVYVVNEE